MTDSYQAIYDAVRSRISNGDIGAAIRDVARDAFDCSHSQVMIRDQFLCVAYEMQRPSAIYRPALSVDGSQWCALYGDNLHDGVAGFGDTPELAMAAFDKAWRFEKTPKERMRLEAAVRDEDIREEAAANDQFGAGA